MLTPVHQKGVFMAQMKSSNRAPVAVTHNEKVAAILQRCTPNIVEDWLGRIKNSKQHNCVTLTDEELTSYLPRLIEDLTVRLRKPNTPGSEDDSPPSPAAVAHGKMRQSQGYTPGMLVHDSRILEVALFEALNNNLGRIEFSSLLPNIMTIADEVDSQLTQAMDSFMNSVQKPEAA
jgi:hypothetical protein